MMKSCKELGENKMEKYSVLMSVYRKDRPDWVEVAINSMLNQTIRPDEVVLIIDGEISNELSEKINHLAKENKEIKVYPNEVNLGLGLSMKKGLALCSNEIVARMDSDDYSLPDRIEKELQLMEEKSLDLVGSQVAEFIEDIDNVVSTHNVPVGEDNILKFAKQRNPFCHPSVIFKKSKVLESGDYQDMKLCEDYFLWIRMLEHGCKMDNHSEVLMKMRVSKDLYARRGGYKYFKSQKELFKYMKKTKFIGIFTYLKILTTRFVVQVLMPNKLRQKFYEKKLRG